MSVSRRQFVRTLGLGSAGTVAAGRMIGARGHEAFGELWASAAGDPPILQLGSNENPNGPGPRALEAVRRAFGLAPRYPYGEANALTAAIARLHSVRSSNVMLGCGSAEVLRVTMQAFTSPTRHLVTIAPTFETPARYADAFAVKVQAVPLDTSLKLDLPAMAARAQGAGVVYVCNPNNPTGIAMPAVAIEAFVARLSAESPQTIVLIDEAYHDYVDDSAYRTSIPLALRYKNTIVSRTFSKLYGMAGLRCGYAVAHADTIGTLTRFKLETSVNQFAIAAALASLDDRDHIERERTLNRAARAYTRRIFEAGGFTVAPSETNFIFVDVRQDARAFRDGCRRNGVIVGRAFSPLDTYVRISIGTIDEMQRAGDTFSRLLRPTAGAPGVRG